MWPYKVSNFSQVMITVVAARSTITMGLMLAKISVGLFILNLVLERWQRIAIWVLMGLLIVFALASVGISWSQCMPVQALWDARYLTTRPWLDTNTMGILHGGKEGSQEVKEVKLSSPKLTTFSIWCLLRLFFCSHVRLLTPFFCAFFWYSLHFFWHLGWGGMVNLALS